MKKKFIICILSAFTLIGFFSCNDVALTNEPPTTQTIATKAAKKYPHMLEIINNATVSSAMNRAWLLTTSSANNSGRREFGFYIYYYDGTYEVGSIISGPLVSGCEGTNANIYPGRPYDNLTVCAFFHTHTPLTFCSTGFRRVGPSPADQAFAASNKLPCLLYDYSSDIEGGHNINAPATIYQFGPTRRQF